MAASSPRRAPPRFPPAAAQRGFALLVLMAIIVVGLAYVMVTGLNASTMKLERERRTDEVLALAKEALIGHAVSDPNRPGELPCPDADNDGQITLSGDYDGSNCKVYLGRLPWKHLDLPDLRDESGEQLWYAVSNGFHENGSNPLNSDTQGTLEVYGPDGTTVITAPGYRAVAILFAPGSIIESQVRGTAAERSNPANYLDSANGRNNATGIAASPPSFIVGAPSQTFNDKLLLITTRDLMPAVEQRVAAAVRKALDDFANKNRDNYPWANPRSSGNDEAVPGYNKGKLPLKLTYHSDEDDDWQDALPTWFKNNRWFDVIYYALAKHHTPSGSCATCSSVAGCPPNHLKVDSNCGVDVAFFMPGTPQGTTVRPSMDWSAYVEDEENHDGDTDGDSVPNNDIFVSPTSMAMDRDRIYYRDASGIWCRGTRTLSGTTCTAQ